MLFGVHPPFPRSREAQTVLPGLGSYIFPPRKRPEVFLCLSLTNTTVRKMTTALPAGFTNGLNRWWYPREKPFVFILGFEAEQWRVKHRDGSYAKCFCLGLGAHPLLRLPVTPCSPTKHVQRFCCWFYELSAGKEIAFCSCVRGMKRQTT